jgi:tetratricopeptide (TPR) repeat protein
VPVWHEQTRQARQSGNLVLLGVIQEQHPDRCRLFAQWKGFDWPILHDPINLLAARAVPIFVAIDEAGVVIDSNLNTSELADFLARPPNNTEQPAPSVRFATSFDSELVDSSDAGEWVEAGDHQLLWGSESQISTVINYYQKAIQLEPDNGAAQFRLGVALRKRYDTGLAQHEDFQSAVDAWGRALDIDPNHYIYRRRIQQYGPRLIKPYPFYDWIKDARDDIKSQGKTPVKLVSEPVGAEMAKPSQVVQQDTQTHAPPDPNGRIVQDLEKLVEASVTVVPGTIAQGEAVRIHLELRPRRTAHWNNEAEPLTVWIDVPEGWTAEKSLLQASQPDEPESREVRSLDFEIKTAKVTQVTTVRGYVLYYVCENEGGQCLFRRQNIEIPIRFGQ